MDVLRLRRLAPIFRTDGEDWVSRSVLEDKASYGAIHIVFELIPLPFFGIKHRYV